MNKVPFNPILETEIFETIFSRLEESKKLWKLLRVSLIESLQSFEHFAKSNSKSLSSLSKPVRFEDPAFHSTQTSRFLNWEKEITQSYLHCCNKSSGQLTKVFDEYSEKLETTASTVNENGSSALKQSELAKLEYAKEKAKYEKVCKETEALVGDMKKMLGDPLLYYNLNHQKKIRVKLWNKIRELKEMENQVKDSIHLMNEKQEVVNSALGDILKVFQVALKTTLQNLIEVVKKQNKGLAEIFERVLEESLKSVIPASLPKDIGEADDKFVDQQLNILIRQEQQQLKGEIVLQAEANEKQRTTFSEVQRKLAENFDLPESQIYFYASLLPKRFEIYSAIIEERKKNLNTLKSFIQEFASHCELFSKQMSKISKNPFHTSGHSSSGFNKRASALLDPYFNTLNGLAKKFSNFGTFIQMKLSILEGVVNDQKASLKSYNANMQKVLKDHATAKLNLENCMQIQERTQKKIEEVAEKDDTDGKLPRLKSELGGIMKQHGEYRHEFRKQTISAAHKVAKIESDYQKQVLTKSQNLKYIIEGILSQENCLYQETLTLISSTTEAITPDEGIDQELMLIFGQDEKLAECLKYVEKKKGTEISLVFQKLYVPPSEYASEYEDEKLGQLGLINGENFLMIDDKNKKVEEEETENLHEEDDASGKEMEKVSPTRLEKKFLLNQNDKLLGDYSCALYQKVLRQGWMYVYETKLCFASSKLFGDAVIKVPMKDIVRAEKKVISLVFDSALTVVTKHGELIFTSFFSRDKAYNLIEELRKNEGKRKNSDEGMQEDGAEENKQEESPSPAIREARILNKEEQSPRLKLVPCEVKGSPVKENLNGGRTESVSPRKVRMNENVDENKNENGNGHGNLNGVHLNREESSEDKTIPHEFTKAKQVNTVRESLILQERQSNKNAPVNVAEPERESQAQANEENEEILKAKRAELERNVQSRRLVVESELKQYEKNSQVVFNEVLNCSVTDLFSAVFSDLPFTSHGKKYHNFIEFTKDNTGDTDIVLDKWAPKPPEILASGLFTGNNIENFINSDIKSRRKFTYTHPVREQSVFAPKTCVVEEKQFAYWISPHEVLIYTEGRSSKVPMSDTFFVKSYYHMKDVKDGERCEFTWRLAVEFVKSSMFKGKITKSVQDENTFIVKKVSPLIKSRVAEFVASKKQLKRVEERKHEIKETVREIQKEEPLQTTLERVKEEEEEKVSKISEDEEETTAMSETPKKRTSAVESNESLENLLKSYLNHSKTSQEQINSELKNIKFWMVIFVIMNTLILLGVWTR